MNACYRQTPPANRVLEKQQMVKSHSNSSQVLAKAQLALPWLRSLGHEH